MSQAKFVAAKQTKTSQATIQNRDTISENPNYKSRSQYRKRKLLDRLLRPAKTSRHGRENEPQLIYTQAGGETH